MKKILTVAALMFFGISGGAHAALVDVTLGNIDNSVTYGSGGTLTPNINLSTPSPASLLLTGNAQIVSGSVLNQYAQPTGSIYGGNYLAVMATPGPAGVGLFSLAPNLDTFGFTWGTIDAFNSLKITDSLGHTFSLTGTDILSRIGNPTPGSIFAQTDIRFVDPFASIVSAEFTSTKNSFEAANFSEAHSAVPLPASLPMFGLGLLGLMVYARRKYAKA